MRNVRLDEAQAGIKIARRKIKKLKISRWQQLIAESNEELKTFFDESEVETEKAVLKHNILKN